MRDLLIFRTVVWTALGSLVLPVSALAQGADPATAPAPSAAPAEAPAEDPEREKKDAAKEHFLRGIDLSQAENWDGALVEFLKSLELYPTRAAQKNAALAARQLKRNAQALTLYRALLSEFASSLSPEEKKTAQDAVSQLQKYVGQLSLMSSQREATALVDGREVGGLPATLALDVGTHTVRIYKSGFIPFEVTLSLTGGETKTVSAQLQALKQGGTLVVRESSGKQLDVLVDGIVVGKTPWQGLVEAGSHAVQLRGDGDLGTPPSSADVRLGRTQTLNLSAVMLDAELSVHPTPSSAEVFIDGVSVGSGVWNGRLTSGKHRVEVSSVAFLAQRRDVMLQKQRPEVLKLTLERDPNDPRWRSLSAHPFLDAFAGVMYAPGLGGAADEACASGDCSDESHGPGLLFGGRAGYQLPSGLALEVAGGYLAIRTEVTRSLAVSARDLPAGISTQDYNDTTTLGGVFAALGASYRLLKDTPLTFRLQGGVGRFGATFENSATYSGADLDPNPQKISITERDESIWVPFVAPEVRFGYRMSALFSFDAGLSFWAFFPPETLRTGVNEREDGTRRASVTRVTAGSGGNPAGVFGLETERGFSTFFALAATAGVRFDL